MRKTRTQNARSSVICAPPMAHHLRRLLRERLNQRWASSSRRRDGNHVEGSRWAGPLGMTETKDGVGGNPSPALRQ